MELYGRTRIETDVKEITADNVRAVLSDAMQIHEKNRKAITYLYNYYRGKQEIRNRTKTYRREICNRVTENRAYEIVTFKTGYLVGEPTQYVSTNAAASDKVLRLNSYMEYNSKATKDTELVEWDMICGTAYMSALPATDEDERKDCPFEIEVLDPRNTFIIYSSEIGHEPLAGVCYSLDKNDNKDILVYTKTEVFSFRNDAMGEITENPIGRIPIIEYPANNARLGSFELCISLLDNINKIDSNRMDGLEQFVQSLLVLYNAELDDGVTAEQIREAGMVLLRNTNENKADIKVISESLDQQQTQTLKDDLYNAVLTICSMPNRNGGSSTSDNGIAVVYRDGWSAAETAAKASEALYKQSDRELRKVIGRLVSDIAGIDIAVTDATCKFTRRSYENIETKSQVLVSMLNNEKIDPKYAYTACGLFVDAEEAYAAGMKWYEDNKSEPVVVSETENTTTEDVTETDDTADI